MHYIKHAKSYHDGLGCFFCHTEKYDIKGRHVQAVRLEGCLIVDNWGHCFYWNNCLNQVFCFGNPYQQVASSVTGIFIHQVVHSGEVLLNSKVKSIFITHTVERQSESWLYIDSVSFTLTDNMICFPEPDY